MISYSVNLYTFNAIFLYMMHFSRSKFDTITIKMSNSEEDVMKMRLLVDGDGTGDDRRLNMMLKALIKWCNAEEDQQTCEVRQIVLMIMFKLSI